MPKLVARPSDPLLITREVDLWYSAIWFVYASWGTLSVILGIRTITEIAGPTFNFGWSLAIALLSWGALACSILLFIRTTWLSQVSKKKIEMMLSIGLFFLILIYPFYLGFRAYMGEEQIWPSVALAVLYLLICAFRAKHLYHRVKNYQRANPGR